MKLSFIVPVYNEEGNIEHFFSELKSYLSKVDFDYEIIFINDGSSDSSAAILERISNDKTIILTNKINSGQSAALSKGIEYASGNWAVLLDSDLQFKIDDLQLFLEQIRNGCQAVYGWRKDRHDTFMYSFLSKTANKIIRIIFNIKEHDCGCAFKLIEMKTLKKMEQTKNFHRYIPILLSKKVENKGEIIVQHRQRRAGNSKYSSWKIFGVIFELFILKLKGY